MKNLNELTKRELQEIANLEFANYEGDFDMLYDGSNDDYVDFGGDGRNFATVERRIFHMTVANTNLTPLDFLLIPGLGYAPDRIKGLIYDEVNDKWILSYANGIVRDGEFPDLTGTSILTGSGSPKKIEDFYNFITNSPIHCHKIKVQASSNPLQISQQLQVMPSSPFRDLGSDIISPDAVLNQDTYQNKVSMFNVDLILSKDTKIQYRILPSESVTISFFCDAGINPSVTLRKKFDRAKNTFTNLTARPLLRDVGRETMKIENDSRRDFKELFTNENIADRRMLK